MLAMWALGAVGLLLCVCVGLGELVFGWPLLSCRPPAGASGDVAAGADRDPTGCGYLYRAVGVGLGLGLAVAIGLGQLFGSVWPGIGVAVALAAVSLAIRAVKQRRLRSTARAAATPAAGSDDACAAPVEPTANDWLTAVAGARRPVRRSDHALLAIAVLATFGFILGGGLRTTQLQDPDGNDHAVGVRWLLDVGPLREPLPNRPVLHYIDAYPPGFDVTAAALGAVLDGRVALPLKLLTALAAALAVAWLFGLVAELTARPRLAHLAVFCFLMAPNNLTAFIWAHSLAFAWFPLLTALQLAHLRDGRWRSGIGSALVLGGICLVSPESGLKVLPWAAVPVALTALRRNGPGLRRLLLAGVLAGLVALIWWGPMFAKYGTYQRLWRAQLAPVVVAEADAGHWQAPPLLNTAGSGDEAINAKVHFWGWDHIGLASESPTLPLSLGWSQSILVLLGLACVLTQHLTAQGLRLRLPDGLAAADGVMTALLAYSVLGMLGPWTGLSLYAYRFVLFLTVPCAYFSARGLAALWVAPAKVGVAAIGLTALAAAGSVFGYGYLRLYAAYWLGLITLWVLIGAVLVGVSTGRGAGLAAMAGRGETTARGSWPARWAVVLVGLLALYAGGLSRYWCSYTQKAPFELIDAVGKTSEREVLDHLQDYLPRGAVVYPAGGMQLNRCVVAQEMRALIFTEFDDAAWNRAVETDPAAAVTQLRAAGVRYLIMGPSFALLGGVQKGMSSAAQQQRVIRLQAGLEAQPGVLRVLAAAAPNHTMAPTVIWELSAKK